MSHLLEDVRAALAGRYLVEEEVGAGGMAMVYRARDPKHDRAVAIKVLRPEISAVVGAERFLIEISVTANLQHPHILPLHDSGEAGGFLYYVMPLVEGESLRNRLDREKQLSLEDTVQVASEIGSALDYAHGHGVIHRDIKPENILLSSGSSVLADFGVARALESVGQESITTTGLVVGTPAYMSPEQASGEAVDGRCDIYALACVVYEMLGGEPPFTGPTPRAILARQLSGEIRPLAQIRNTVSPEVDAVLERAMAPTPADRFQTGLEFAQALRGEAGDRPTNRWPAGVRRLHHGVLGKVLIAAGAMLLVLLAVRTFVLVPPSHGVGRPASLVVFPFRGQGDQAGPLGEGVADLLAAAIDGTVGLSVADPNTMWRGLRSSDDEIRAPELSDALAAATRVSARNVVLGSVTVSGTGLSIAVRLYDESGDVVATLNASGPVDSLAQAVDRLAIDIVAEVWQRDSLPTVPAIERLATDNAEALKAYLEAKRLVYAGHYARAEAPIDKAVSLDSTFALALLTQFNVRSWNKYLNAQPFIGLTPIIDQATRHRDRLSMRNRLHVEAAKALDDTDGELAAAIYDRIIGLDSLDIGARRGLAFAYLVYGWQMRKAFPDIAAAYDAVLVFDPADPSGVAQLLGIGMWRDDQEGLRRNLTRLLAMDTTTANTAGILGSVRALQAEGPAQDSILDALSVQPAPVVITALRRLRSARPDVAQRFIDRLLADSMPAFHRRLGVGVGTQLNIGVGRIAEADSAVRNGELEPLRPTVNRMMVAAALAGVGQPAATARAVEELAASAPADSLMAMMETGQPWRAGWSVAAYHASLGDTAEARVWQAALAELPQGLTWPWQEALADDIEARLAMRRGDLATAEREAREAYRKWIIHSGTVNEGDPEPNLRFHLAEVLRVSGNVEEARWLYRSFGPPHSWAGYLTARASLELGALAEAEGDWSEAAFRYGQALGLWQLGGDEVAAWRDRAGEGLERVLTHEG